MAMHMKKSFLMVITPMIASMGRKSVEVNTVNSRFKKDLKLQIHLHKAFFSDDRFLDSLHKSFLNQTTLDLRKEKWTFLNREITVQHCGGKTGLVLT